ncbi:MAG: metallophosphoesterase [Phycisphaerales bacterium]
MRTKFRTAVAAAILGAAGLGVSAHGTVGDFRVLPYQLSPTGEGITLTWFTIDEVPGTLTIEGPGLTEPLVLASAPVLQPVLDYQAPAELNAGGAFPFLDTAILDGQGNAARNWKHSIVLGGLQGDAQYTYTVQQGETAHAGVFRTAPPSDTDRSIRFVALADSETLVIGRTTFREWSATTPQAPGSTGRPEGTGPGRTQYLVTETVGYQENIKNIIARGPELVVMPGDLIQGTSNEQQRRWDEFWRHNAGEYDTLLTNVPLIAAIGNNCIFNGTAGGANPNVKYARDQWSAYFDFPSNGNADYQDLYFRTDYGPITIITLCSVGALPPNDDVAPPVGQGVSVDFPQNLDTNRAWLTGYPFGDLPDFNIGTEQWNWAVEQLADARDAGQVIFVQWHHTPFSRGVHGSSVTSNQSGEAMRIYAPLMEQYGVAGVLCGHSEVSEMSYFDLNGDGLGVFLWDVGAAGDGLRGVEDAPGQEAANIIGWRNNPLNPEGQDWVPNPFSRWTADQSEPELWDGNQLLSGGKHYGFLEIDVEPIADGEFRVSFQNWHSFPVTNGDEDFTVVGFELRQYSNSLVLEGPAHDLRPVVPCGFTDLNRDGQVDSDDLGLLLGAFGASPAGDVDGDGTTDSFDLGLLLGAFGNRCR